MFVCVITAYLNHRHDIYKWQRRPSARQRAVSYAGVTKAPPPEFEHIHEPGGFRRNYVILRAHEQGEEQPRIPRNFIEFLYLFGHFVSLRTCDRCNRLLIMLQAGEDLEEDEDEDKEVAPQVPSASALEAGDQPADSEQSPLLQRTMSRSRRRRMSIGPTGDATVTQAVLMVTEMFHNLFPITH